MESANQKLPKGMSQTERLEDLFDKGFERITLRPHAPRGPKRNARMPYTIKMEVILENNNFMMQTIVYERRRGNCRYIGTFKYFLCTKKDAEECGENGIHN